MHDHVFLPAIDPHRLGGIIINDLSPNTIGTVEVHFHGAWAIFQRKFEDYIHYREEIFSLQ